MSLTPIQIGYIGMGALIFLIFIRMPIGMAMLLVGAGGFAAINGVEPAVALLQNVPYETFIQYSYCVVPLFILMGNFAFKSGLSSDLYWAVRKMMGSLRGGWPWLPWERAGPLPPSAAPAWPRPSPWASWLCRK